MKKVLRSFIQEKFPLDLRVELELLSKRRDLVNKEKQTELFNILKKYDLDVTALGPGTNRYAFKYESFVIKFATNNDGKIDNLKEFRMGKLLFPYVIKVYEVSENGTIMICEYIRPFGDFVEMQMYEKEIKAILKKLSDLYLIGDVGLIQNNYANWGLRIGTNAPVCLDFAYVYSVNSELFACHSCNTSSILVPTEDYSALKCLSCGKQFTFEDIRRRISNEDHMKEIGALGDIGYRMTFSSEMTELDDKRSSYLRVKKKVKKDEDVVKKDEHPAMKDDFCLSRNN